MKDNQGPTSFFQQNVLPYDLKKCRGQMIGRLNHGVV